MEERLGFINLDRIKAIMDKVQCKYNMICFSKSETILETKINIIFYFNFNST